MLVPDQLVLQGDTKVKPSIFVMENWEPRTRELIVALKPEGFDIHFWSGDQAELAERLPSAQYVMVEATPLPEATIKLARNAKLIQKYGTGVDMIDVAAAKAMGIPVYYTPGANSVSTAEMAIALMLATYRHLCDVHHGLKAGLWMKAAVKLTSHELYGKTVGVVGCGEIGKHVARRLSRGFECDVIYHNRHRLPAAEEDALGISYRGFGELLRQSDIVTLHLPLTEQTRGIIGARELSMMKPSAVLINSCRGPVVDEAALAEALRKGVIAGAGLDVFEQEPPSPDSPLLSLDNVVVSPHCGGGTLEAVTRVVRRAFTNIERFEAGEPLPERDRVG